MKDGQYLTYEEFQNLGGTLDEAPFILLEFKARKKIDELTNNRLVNLTTQVKEVKMCMYELIDIFGKSENTIYASESTDGYSVSYKTSTELNNAMKSIIKSYLQNCTLIDGTPYMYCGSDYHAYEF